MNLVFNTILPKPLIIHLNLEDNLLSYSLKYKYTFQFAVRLIFSHDKDLYYLFLFIKTFDIDKFKYIKKN